MNKILSLVNVQLGATLLDMLSIGNNRKRKPKALYAGLILFALFLSAVAFFYSLMIGTGLKKFNSLEILPMMMIAVTSVLVLFTTVFKIKGTIFGFKDYDMIMSLPVSTGGIVASRLILLYSINMVFVMIVIIPMMIAYGVLANPGVLFYLYGLLLIIAVPMLPIVVASILGTVVAYAASRFRYSNILSIVFSLGIMVALMGSSFMMGDSEQEFVDLTKALTNQVNSIYPLADLYKRAVCDYDLSAVIIFLGISLLGFILYALIVGKVFKKMNTLILSKNSRANYKMGDLKVSSPLRALYKKEIRRYFASTIYVLNTGIGVVLLTVGAIALLFVNPEKALGDPQAALVIRNYGPVIIAFCISTSCTTMASISLEGKNFWIVKTLPVKAKTVFLSKIAVNLTIIAPMLLDVLLIGIILKYSLLQTIFALLITVAFAVFVSIYGLIINLKFPNLNWVTEVIVVKQSVASLISIFSGMALTGVLVLFLSVLPSYNIAYLMFVILLVIFDVVLYQVLVKWGPNAFRRLS